MLRGAACPGRIACLGNQYARGRVSSITGLYISLYEIEENLVSGIEWKNNSTYSLNKVDLGASETLFSMICGIIFQLKDKNKLF
jgi:hypothetical protein